MSLLIDALRKAEQDRAQTHDADVQATIDELSLEPLAPIALADPAPADATASTERAAAANLFAVKHASHEHTRLRWIGGIGLLAALGIVGYVWWQWPTTRPAPTPMAARTPPPAARAIAPPPPPVAAAPAPAPPVAAAVIAAPAPVRQPQRGALGTAAAPPQAAAPDSATHPQFRRTQAAAPAVPASLSSAYEAYAAGDLASAHRHYQSYLTQDPNSTDALNGLGAIALHQGQNNRAAQWFRRALVADPNNASAIAGLSAAGQRPAEDREASLRQALANQPESASAAFSLGNVLAEQGRWAEAQQAYFQAHTLNPDSPDYLFNLAVSLDQLGERRLAMDYYSRALDAAQNRATVFDPVPVRARRDALAEALQ
ncbi:tetratricopeptide repeat protein [Zoogloeaceae bacterium G21618-S1]|nr:tetratricopeptide repeat protein [Zoogloeaceae bacterium G21618-S1]